VWGSGCIDPRFLDLGSGWKRVFSFTPRPLYLRGKGPGTHWIGDLVAAEHIWTLWTENSWPLGNSARSQTLSRVPEEAMKDEIRFWRQPGQLTSSQRWLRRVQPSVMPHSLKGPTFRRNILLSICNLTRDYANLLIALFLDPEHEDGDPTTRRYNTNSFSQGPPGFSHRAKLSKGVPTIISATHNDGVLGRWVIAPPFLTLGLDGSEWSVLHPGRFTTSPGTHWIRNGRVQ
jgi:hypothetical protein